MANNHSNELVDVLGKTLTGISETMKAQLEQQNRHLAEQIQLFKEQSEKQDQRIKTIYVLVVIGLIVVGLHAASIIYSINEDMESMSKDMRIMTTNMINMNENMGIMAKKMTHMSGDMAAMQTDMGQMSGDMKMMQENVTVMTTHVVTMSRDMTVMTDHMINMSRDMGIMNRSVTPTMNRIGSFPWPW